VEVFVKLPFTVDQFFDVFRRYNDAVWPAQWVLVALALIAIAGAVRATARAARIVSASLACLWLWMAFAYHIAFFSKINPMAPVFGALFLVQGLILLPLGGYKDLAFEPRRDLAGVMGALLVIYALVIYPALGFVLGRRYPALPTFGLPCPTTIFTLGLLLWARPAAPRRVVVIPLLWAAIASTAALRLGVREDLGLTVSALIVAAVHLRAARHVHSKPSSVHGLEAAVEVCP
jgi:uncharacterized protein DUF6064